MLQPTYLSFQLMADALSYRFLTNDDFMPCKPSQFIMELERHNMCEIPGGGGRCGTSTGSSKEQSQRTLCSTSGQEGRQHKVTKV